MSGQATVTIRDKTWTVGLALTPNELTRGLGGLASIPADTGLLFDLGAERIITVTTMPMLFPIDIVFLDAGFRVTDLARSQAPGFVLASEIPARYFLEVNAGETAAAGIEVGDLAAVNVTQQPTAQQASLDLGALMTTVIEASMLAWGMMGMARTLFPTREDVFKVLPTGRELKEYGRAIVPTRQELRNLLPDARREALVYFVYVGSKVGATTNRVEAIQYATARGGQVYSVPRSIWREGGAFGVDAPTVRIIGDLIFDAGKEGRTARLDPGYPEAKRMMAPGQFTIRDRALDKLKPFDVIEVHDDGDVTVSHKGTNYVVTTGGEVFRETDRNPRTVPASHMGEMPKRITQGGGMDYLADSPEWVALTIDDIGYRDKLDCAFQDGIRRASHAG